MKRLTRSSLASFGKKRWESILCYHPRAGTTAKPAGLVSQFVGANTARGGRDMTIPTVGSRPPLRPGETAPDFSLPLVSEVGTASLKDYLGRTPVLIVLLRYIW
jgi:hypothetical protein